jgi:hypothetical protein
MFVRPLKYNIDIKIVTKMEVIFMSLLRRADLNSVVLL